MEGVHGVDVGWLHHHAGKDYRKTKTGSNAGSKSSSRAPSPPPPAPKPLQDRKIDSALQREGLVSQTPSIPISTTSAHKSQQKRSLMHRANSDKSPTTGTSPGVEDSRTSSRPTWMRNLSSKFTSQPQSQSLASRSPPQPSSEVASSDTQPLHTARPVPLAVSDRTSSESVVRIEETEPFVQQSPKTGNSFFSSALRRLSSTGPGNSSKTPSSESTCPRRVLNVDKERERCKINGLDERALRRVAFSVDVEVAGVSRYNEEQAPTTPSQMTREQKFQARSEGEALKGSEAAREDAERASVLGGAAEEPRRASRNSVDDILEDEMMAAAKRQDMDTAYRRKQEKEERRRRRAQEEPQRTDILPRTQSGPQLVNVDTPSQETIPPHQDRPTTDPVRMYRRCCQLREAPVLKRISEQLATLKPEVEKTGYVACLDLNGSRMQLPDITCLGDWLAIVPVKKLLIDNANLSDEGLRVILSGLLAVKPQDSSRQRKRGKSSPTRRREDNMRRPHGVIEKLSLRMNTKITRDGWKHICIFLNLSHSIKAIDLSLIPFPKRQETASSTGEKGVPSQSNRLSQATADILHDSLSQRSTSSHLEEFIVSDCALDTYDVMKIVDAACTSGISRLGLAKNHLRPEDLQHVKRYLQSGCCKGLDLGGNDLRTGVGTLATAVSGQDTLWALSIADCNLDSPALATLLPALTSLSNFRFLDLSHNRDLFGTTNEALAMLRKYLPKLRYLRRLHLADVSMSLQEAIALAETLPEIRNINHVSLLENPDLRKLSFGLDAATQEDACALYASLMVAVRISKTLLAVDIEVPSSNTNQVVQALAKQVVAYAFRNMDRYTSVDAMNLQDPASVVPDTLDRGKEVQVPEILSHLVGSIEGDPNQIDKTNSGNSQDYTVGSQGVVKALSYVLGQQGADARRKSNSVDGTQSSGSTDLTSQKAGDMSKGLLSSARQIRAKIVTQLAAAQDTQPDDEFAYRRLQYLDATLGKMIRRFEDAYPDCALPHFNDTPYPFRVAADHGNAPLANPTDAGPEPIESTASPSHTPPRSRSSTTSQSSMVLEGSTRADEFANGDSRRGSAVNLAARAQSIEEGNMHRFGQHVRRNVLPPHGTDDHLHRTSVADPAEEPHIVTLRQQLEALEGEELREQVIKNGIAATMRDIEGRGQRLRIDANDNEIPVMTKQGTDDALAALEGQHLR